jgi:hypothetical protein
MITFHSPQEQSPARESEYDYFMRLARERAGDQRRQRRERVLRKLVRRPSRDRRSS